jgi:biopolymer transport protein TolR
MAMGLHAKRRGRRGRAPMAEINVTPLVDVMLVLLIIFMVTAPLLTAGVPIELPDSRANALDQDPKQVTVSIDREGYIYIDKDQVPVGGFPDALARLKQGGGEVPQVTLRADKALDYGRVMAVMGELNRSGFNSISLVTSGAVPAEAVIGGSVLAP